jgi:hypothetical protein
MTDMTEKAARAASDDGSAASEPTQAEIDAWAARERQRREAWINGPSEAERAEYAAHLRHRRLASTFDEGEARIADTVRMGVRLGRESQLAAEGAVALMYRFSRRTFAELVRAGREWEEETSLPTGRRRVSMDDVGS